MWAVLFPGQGSQAVGMGKFYYEQFPLARQLFDLASEELQIDFKKLCLEGPESELMLTQNAQPAIVLVSSTAWFCLKKELNLDSIQYCAGHSVGEYSALVCAGVLDLITALKAVRKRGLYMSESCPPGTGSMSALLGPSPLEAKKFCKWVEEESGCTPLVPANFNSPEQTVLSGDISALKWAQTYYKQYSFQSKKIKLIPLKVAGPFHSPLMNTAYQKMNEFLSPVKFQKPDKQIVQNTTAQAEEEPHLLKKNIIEQVKASVLWTQSMEYLIQKKVKYFIELGEGRVLSGLMKKIDIEKTVFSFSAFKDIDSIKQYYLK